VHLATYIIYYCILQRAAKIFAKYNAANEAKIKLENEPGSARCHGKDNVDLVLKLKGEQYTAFFN
jgi:Zn finger protein HypA/HybF involved in hydrogenase expression